jgi:hypothetical protein
MLSQLKKRRSLHRLCCKDDTNVFKFCIWYKVMHGDVFINFLNLSILKVNVKKDGLWRSNVIKKGHQIIIAWILFISNI